MIGFRLMAAALAVAALAGCVSEDAAAAKAVAAIQAGDWASAEAWADDLIDNSRYSRNRGLIERGRIGFLRGDYAAAEKHLREAVETAVSRQESEPEIKLGDVGNTVLSATVTDDRTRKYYLSPYELNLALEYSILSEHMLGHREEALVDCRLAAYVQDRLAETYGADVAAAESPTNAAANAVFVRESAQLEALIAATRNSWENPVLWWLGGALHEANGDRDAAAQNYARAAALAPGNRFFAADSERIRQSVSSPQPGRSKLVVIFGDGFVLRRKSVKVPVPAYTGMGIDIPMYDGQPWKPPEAAIGVDGGTPSPMAAGTDIIALASRDLREDMPGVITRNITRALVQAGAQAAANSSGNNYAKAAVFIGNLIITAIRRADVRSWVTLPKGELVWCDDTLEPGAHQVDVFIDGRPVTVQVVLLPGETKLVYLSTLEEPKEDTK